MSGNNCGAQFDDVDDAGRHCVADFWDNCENYSYQTVGYTTVVDSPESTTEVCDYTYCSRCGARQQLIAIPTTCKTGGGIFF